MVERIPGREALRRPVAEELRHWFSIDVRALAALRMSLGATLFVDVATRMRHVTPFYTDAGVLPRAAHPIDLPVIGIPSFHAISGGAAIPLLLFLLAAVCAVGVTVGYRSRPLAALAVVLQASTYLRNPLVTHGGDAILLIGLVLLVVLPVDAVWALRPSSRSDGRRVVNLATATLLLQPIALYTTNAAFKLESDLWRRGDAVEHVLSLDQFAVGLAPVLTGFGDGMTVLTWAWIGLMAGSVLLLVTDGWVRTMLVGTFVTFHLGMLATMELGLFPLATAALLLAFIPTPVWNAVGRSVPTLPSPIISRRAESAIGIPRWRRIASILVLATLLVGTLVWPMLAVAPTGSAVPGYPLQLFAPDPPEESRSYAFVGDTTEDHRVDVLTGEPIDRIEDAAQAQRGILWNGYLSEVHAAGEREHRAFGRYLCTRGEDARVERVTGYVLAGPTEVIGGGDRETRQLFDVTCAGG